MSSIEEYQNLIEVLKKALEFYADSNSYRVPAQSDSDYKFNCMRPEFHLKRVEIDGGSQACFALAKIKEIKDNEEKMQGDYDKIVNNMSDEINKNPIVNTDYKTLIEQYRNFKKYLDNK